ncbi:hypothetical protein ACRALDRAFT_1070132 [Sodiomyces alcalophilus JCM 7366]|uniref:uncharacterized protein n=1 Tax=Sodiomyces alcalophilus JCM 7366 TaxID=591952 RepID=UPI0039B6BF8B
MASLKLTDMPSLRRQHTLAEFNSLKHACPEGVFVSPTPGDPSLWPGVMFIRRGPYENAALRFQISFADTYPQSPPLITFATDMFHPLLAPLTTYMYTTDVQDNGTVSATDDERLPPGGFSLRHGFPGWLGRRGRTQAGSRHASWDQHPQQQQQPPGTPVKADDGNGSTMTTPGSTRTTAATTSGEGGRPTIYEVLRYIRSTFDDEAVLDSVPLQAAGNPGAWHAWRTRQRMKKPDPHVVATTATPSAGDQSQNDEGEDCDPKEGEPAGEETGAAPLPSGPVTPTVAARQTGEWNWEGVWEDRVRKGIATSLSDPVLYGCSSAGAGDDLIHFLAMEENDVAAVKENLLRTLGASV